MERKNKRIFFSIWLVAFVTVLFAFILLPYYNNTVYAEGETQYSNVLDDLKKDNSFSMEHYPEVSLENSEGETDEEKKTNYARLDLIQIAESVNKELFVYVYQPSGKTLDLKANYISLSTEPKENIEPKIYKLKFLNSNETIYKYVVEDFTVLSDDVRYYGIVELFRPFNENYDKGTDNDNTVNSVSYKVAKQYRYGLVNGEYSVQVTEMETIKITENYVGFCRYPAGYNLFNIDLEKACDAHFVAFDTDKPIDRLVSATVFYTSQSFSKTTATFAEPTIKYGEAVDSEPLKIDGEKVSYTGDGLWAGTYEWIRIETVEDFIANEERNDVYEHGLLKQEITTKLSKETLEQNLDGKKWVLRFLETDYLYDQTNTPYVTTQHVEFFHSFFSLALRDIYIISYPFSLHNLLPPLIFLLFLWILSFHFKIILFFALSVFPRLWRKVGLPLVPTRIGIYPSFLYLVRCAEGHKWQTAVKPPAVCSLDQMLTVPMNL